jgi:cell division protein FtsL
VQTLFVILLWLALLYVATLAAVMVVSMWILRQKLRKYQENGRFGY